MKNQPKRIAEKPMTMYAIGEAKYPFISLCAMASMLFMDSLFHDRLERRVLGCEVQEDLFEAHAERPELEEPPAVRDDRRCQQTPDVLTRTTVDFKHAGRSASIRRRDACDARNRFQRAFHVRRRWRVDLQVH